MEIMEEFQDHKLESFNKYLPGFNKLNKSTNMILESINRSMKILKMCSKSFSSLKEHWER